MRSVIWGRKSPSSGFIVPNSVNREGYSMTCWPRLTRTTPCAAASSSTSTMTSLSRLISSMYRIARLAAAANLGGTRSYRLRAPTVRRGCRRHRRSGRWPAVRRWRSARGARSTGRSRPPRTPRRGAAVRIATVRAARPEAAGTSSPTPRTIEVLPIPFGPESNTPPMRGSIAASSTASFGSSWRRLQRTDTQRVPRVEPSSRRLQATPSWGLADGGVL